MGIRPKELSKLGYTDNVARSLAITLVQKYCKHNTKDEVVKILIDIQENPDNYKDDEVWYKLADHFSPTYEEEVFTVYNLEEEILGYKTYGGKFIDTLAKQQMNLAMQLPISVAGALMPDAHAGYGLPIGGVLAVDNAVIPYAVGVDVACRMSLTIFDAKSNYLNRYATQVKRALHDYTHFGMKSEATYNRDHAILDSPLFQATPLLKTMHGRAVQQLGTSGGGNHFVEFGEIDLMPNNVLGLEAGKYIALLSHSGSRALGANIANYYCQAAREVCKLPREAQHFAWLDLDSELGIEYWLSMNLAGEYAKACHEKIHENLSKALGLIPLTNISNHHNFAWKEDVSGKQAIVHRKGATPARKGEIGFIPGSMATPGYLVCGKGSEESLNSASHGAGRAMSRQKAKSTFTNSALKKLLAEKGVSLQGGSVEEMPLAYKDIEKVMDAQKSLVDIHGTFMPKIVRMNRE